MQYASNANVCDEINKLHESTLSLILSTMDEQNQLETSYTPYVYHDEAYYFLISELAPHTTNMQINPNICMLIIEDEKNAKNIYARTRLSYKCLATKLGQDYQNYQDIIQLLKKRAGKTVELLMSIKDFYLFKVVPIEGRLIIGFGKAYLLNAKTQEVIHVSKDVLRKSSSVS